MHVQINTANNIDGREALNRHLESAIRQRLSRFDGRLTDVEMHITNANGAHGGGEDNRCVVEARPAGLDPVTVTEHAASIEQAASGALGRMVTALERAFGRLSDRKGH